MKQIIINMDVESQRCKRNLFLAMQQVNNLIAGLDELDDLIVTVHAPDEEYLFTLQDNNGTSAFTVSYWMNPLNGELLDTETDGGRDGWEG